MHAWRHRARRSALYGPVAAVLGEPSQAVWQLGNLRAEWERVYGNPDNRDLQGALAWHERWFPASCAGSPRRSSATRPAAGWCGRARGDEAGQNTIRQPTAEVPNELQLDNKEVELQVLTPAGVRIIDPLHSTRNLGFGGRDDLNRKLVGPAKVLVGTLPRLKEHHRWCR